MKIVEGSPLKEKTIIPLVIGVNWANGAPYMQVDGEARNVYKNQKTDWYVDTDTKKIELK